MIKVKEGILANLDLLKLKSLKAKVQLSQDGGCKLSKEDVTLLSKCLNTLLYIHKNNSSCFKGLTSKNGKELNTLDKYLCCKTNAKMYTEYILFENGRNFVENVFYIVKYAGFIEKEYYLVLRDGSVFRLLGRRLYSNFTGLNIDFLKNKFITGCYIGRIANDLSKCYVNKLSQLKGYYIMNAGLCGKSYDERGNVFSVFETDFINCEYCTVQEEVLLKKITNKVISLIDIYREQEYSWL